MTRPMYYRLDGHRPVPCDRDDFVRMGSLTRAGPVYLWWSEYSDAAVIGPNEGAWGGDDIYRCDACPDWDGDSETVDAHAAHHGYFVRFYDVRKP